MKLADFIHSLGITRTEAARQLRWPNAKITRLCVDDAWPASGADARRLFEWSGGQVTPLDFMPPPGSDDPLTLAHYVPAGERGRPPKADADEDETDGAEA